MPSVFEFSIDDELKFRCQLKSETCISKKVDGEDCKRKSIIGTPYCWTHLLKEKKLRIRQTSLTDPKTKQPFLFQGLFAQHSNPQLQVNLLPPVFKKGEEIITYYGEMITTEEINRRYDESPINQHTAPYGVRIYRNSEPKYIDSACQRGVASLANHKPKSRANAELKDVMENRRYVGIKIVATRDIRHNDEIFIPYGRNYRQPSNRIKHYTKKNKVPQPNFYVD